MSLDRPYSVDAIGIDRDSGAVVLTLVDSWDWREAGKHSKALESKLDAYFAFIESGEIFESYPDAKGRKVVIDVITRFPLSPVGRSLLESAAKVARPLGVEVKTRRV